MVYVDDDTDRLNTVDYVWDKSRLIKLGHPELRAARLTDQLAIEVDGQRIEETASEKLHGIVTNNKLSEKLLGIFTNNKLSLKEHLYGDKDNPRLMPAFPARRLKLKN